LAGFDDQHLRWEWVFPVPHPRPPRLRSAWRAASRRAATAAMRLYAGAVASAAAANDVLLRYFGPLSLVADCS
jgi:hypothetical protein